MSKTTGLLNYGDTIALAASARFIDSEQLQYAIVLLRAMGFQIIVAPNVLTKYNQFAGDDNTRVNAFNELLKNKIIKAIFIVRGGYGTARIVDSINWNDFKNNPKLIMGFSDVTVLHNHILQHVGMPTLHCEMPINFNNVNKSKSVEYLNYILLENKTINYSILPHTLNKVANAKGKLVGGNLSVLYSLINTKSDVDTQNTVLFIEDIDEYLYHIDRMMLCLKRAGKLKSLKALLVGSFSDIKDNIIPFGKTAEEIIFEHVQEYNYPIIFNIPAGHGNENYPLVIGAHCEIECNNEKINLIINSNVNYE